MPPTTQVNSATLITGVTGSGKSSLARTLAEYLWETYKKVLYYYACDGGGYPAPVQEGIALGIIKVFRMRTRDPGDLGLAFETCYRAAQGWWPRRIMPATGEVPPGVEMVPPVMRYFQMYCPNGHLTKSVVLQSMLSPGPCPQCKTMTTLQNARVETVIVASKGFEDRGGCFFDGLSSMLSWELMELGQRAGKLELKGEEAAIGGKVTSGDLKFGGTTRSHVGFAQTRGEELAHLSLGIPNLLVPPVFTALSMEGDEGAQTIIGPKIAGRAKTDEAPQWFGNCLEAAKIPAETGPGETFVLYLSEFTDALGRKHLLKHRGAPGTMPDKLVDPPNNEAPFSQFNLGVFFRLLQTALDSGVAAARERYPDAPGVSAQMEEYGDGGASLKPEAPAVAAGPQTLTAEAPAGLTGDLQGGQTVKAPAATPKPRAKKPPTAVAAPPTPEPPPATAPEPPPVQEPPAEPPAPPAPVAAATPATPPAPPTQAPVPSAPGNGSAAPIARPVAAPPPGRRPIPAPARPLAAAPGNGAAGAAGPTMKPPAAAPRPPAAAPRPKP